MANYSRVKNWVSNEILTAGDLNAEFNNILNNSDPSGIEDASANVAAMQSVADPGGVGTESLATALLGEIQRLRFAVKRIVGGAQWYSAPVKSLADLASGSAGQQISSSSASFSSSSGSSTPVTNLTVTITTLGRPVLLSLQPAGGTLSASVSIDGDSGINDPNILLFFKRGASAIAKFNFYLSAKEASSFGAGLHLPPTAFWFIDTPAAGTYTYTCEVLCDDLGGNPTTARVTNTTLLAVEL
jgi:hypothetical protein